MLNVIDLPSIAWDGCCKLGIDGETETCDDGTDDPPEQAHTYRSTLGENRRGGRKDSCAYYSIDDEQGC